MKLVEVQNLVKQYTSDAPNAVDGLSFEIQQGEIFSLLGPNGAGKTTTISIISTLLRPTSGRVVVNGCDVLRDPLGVRQSIGVVPQELALYDNLSAQENLRFWGEMRGLRGDSLKREIAEKLAMTGLSDHAQARVKTFSGGMKRRLNIAVGLLGNPPLVLMDEPTVGIDPQSRRYILDWIKQLNENGVTVLYTTHYMEEAQELSHRLGIIDHGKLIALGRLDELTQLVGAHETLKLQVSAANSLSNFVQAVRALVGVLQADAQETNVTLNVLSAESTLPALLEQAAAHGIRVRNIEIHEPNLEAVFLHLTGRALRD